MTDLVGHGAFVVVERIGISLPLLLVRVDVLLALFAPRNASRFCGLSSRRSIVPKPSGHGKLFLGAAVDSSLIRQNARQAQAFGHVPCQLYSKPSRLESFLFQSAQPRNRKAAPKPGAPAVTQTGRRRPFPLGGFRVGRARFSLHFFGHGLKHCACLAGVPDCCGPATASQSNKTLAQLKLLSKSDCMGGAINLFSNRRFPCKSRCMENKQDLRVCFVCRWILIPRERTWHVCRVRGIGCFLGSSYFPDDGASTSSISSLCCGIMLSMFQASV